MMATRQAMKIDLKASLIVASSNLAGTTTRTYICNLSLAFQLHCLLGGLFSLPTEAEKLWLL